MKESISWNSSRVLKNKASWIDQAKISQIERISDEMTAVYFDDGRRLELLENEQELLESWGVLHP